MAAPRKRAIPPPPWWKRSIEKRSVQAAALLTLFSLFSFLFGTTRDVALALWRHYAGAELVYEIAPQVQELRDLSNRALALTESNVERIDVSEKRLKKAEQTLQAAQDAKAIDSERQAAVEKTQRSACLTRELSGDACNRLGYPTEEK